MNTDALVEQLLYINDEYSKAYGFDKAESPIQEAIVVIKRLDAVSDSTLIEKLKEAYDNPRGDIMWRAGLARAMGIVKLHYEGRPAVEGKPLELQTRDELLAYIRQHQAEPSQDEVERVAIACFADEVILCAADVHEVSEAENLWPEQSDEIKNGWRERAISAIKAMNRKLMGDAGNYSARNPIGTVGVKVPEATSPAKPACGEMPVSLKKYGEIAKQAIGALPVALIAEQTAYEFIAKTILDAAEVQYAD